jgi:hypothetical protein
MPISVKVFFWLLIAFLAWGLWEVISIFVFTPPDLAAHLTHLSESTRKLFWSGMYIGMAEPLAIHLFVPLILAVLIVFARQGWARWLLALYFLSTKILPPLLIARYDLQNPEFSHQTSFWPVIHDYLLNHWLRPAPYLVLAFEILLMVLVFSPNARPWFRHNTAPAGRP